MQSVDGGQEGGHAQQDVGELPPGAEIYNTDRFAELYNASHSPALENLGLAARFMIAFFQYHSIPFAFLGGWAVYLRGGSRETEDIDMTVATSMEHLKAALMSEPRICIPITHGWTSIQIFLHTGGDWDPGFPNVPQRTVSADIIIRGNLGTPQDLNAGTEVIQPSPVTTQGPGVVPVIDFFYQFTGKLRAHYDRREKGSTKDYEDLCFLARKYPAQLWAFRDFMNYEHRYTFCLDVTARDPGDIHDFSSALGIQLGLPESEAAIPAA